ncbi:immunoglobulin domain-containing protein [Ketobacter sp.]|uniref:immunoglobulin domain-containing protein n=1 Tax=Ketobacter sp. TaxID=2083498 RepID=UPI0025B88369|nr:immunoglobulin domain-containing protein [Ketobacter sp.]
MTFSRKVILAFSLATTLLLLGGCKDLGEQSASDDGRDPVPATDSGEKEPTFYPIQINSAPIGLTGYEGQSATFTVTASSEATLTYQWSHNGTPIDGATQATLSFIIAGAEDAGRYEVVVSNSSTAAKASALLTIQNLPEITREPRDVDIYPGETAVFSVQASGDELVYEWQARGFAGWSTLEETSNTLVVENVGSSTKKQYRVKVGNHGGQKTSRTTRINLKNAPSITSHPVDVQVAGGANAGFSVAATGYGSLTYQWHKAGVPLNASSKYQGVTSANLTITNVSSSDASLYHVIVRNSDGLSTRSNAAELSIVGPATITLNPSDTTLYTGQSGALRVAASGDKPIAYQWQKLNGSSWQNIAGATASQLKFDAVSTSVAGQYRCRVSNSAASDISASATVKVLQSVAITRSPASKSVPAGESVAFTVQASGDGLRYEWRKNGQVIPGSSPTLSFASVRELDEASYSCRVFNDGSSANCASFNLDVLSAVKIVTQPVSVTTYEGGSASLSVVASGDPEPTVEWYRNSTLVGRGNTLTLNYITPEQAGDYRCLVKNSSGAVYCNTATITVNQSVAITAQPSSTAADEGSSLTLKVEATGSNLTYGWWKDGSSLSTNSATLNLTRLTPQDAGTYTCRVWNDHSRARCSDFSVSINGKVTITRQPVAASGYEDDGLTLSVEHSGSADTQVQWFHNGALLPTSGKTLTLAPLRMNMAGDYRCVVQNAVNSVSCNTVTVAVMEKVRITKQLSNQILPAGKDILLDIQATGALPITYRCFKNGALLVTTQNPADLIIPGSTASDSGQYHCQLSNAGSAATSTTAEVTILTDEKGSIMLSWNPPQKRADGSRLEAGEIQGYSIYMATEVDGGYDQVKHTNKTSAEITNLAVDTYYIRITTVDSMGLESAMSAPIPITLN